MSAPAAKAQALTVTRAELEDFLYLEAALLDEWRLDEWLALFASVDACAEPVRDFGEVFDDPQVKHRGLLHEVDHPVSGRIKVVGPPWRISGTPTEVRPPPTLGQHTAEVLREWLGINLEELK